MKTNSDSGLETLKSKYSIRDCAVVVEKIKNVSSSCIWNSEFNAVSERLTTETNKRSVSALSNEHLSHSTPSTTMPQKKDKRQKAVSRLTQVAAIDQVSTNSDESNDRILEEVDWEANVETDNKLVDEFAPRVLNTKCEENGIEVVTESEVYSESAEEQEETQRSLEVGDNIFVHVQEAIDRPNEWYSAVIVETDDDEEVLIKYTQGNPPPPMEWLSVSSNRISCKMPTQNSGPQDSKACKDLSAQEGSLNSKNLQASVNLSAIEDPTFVSSTVVEKKPDVDVSPKKKPDVVDSSPKKKPDVEVSPKKKPDVDVSPKKKPDVDVSPKKKPDVDVSPKKEEVKEVDERGPALQIHSERDQIVRIRGGPRVRGGAYRKNRGLLDSHRPLPTSKFSVNEKVLAKWSEHRMQKFPAVIKRALPDRKYDVLFYDGFEKTIEEDHLYKTTEEEVAKYQHAKPSEADLFVDMDANSKEARRQRKKKTFDDYVFARDYGPWKKKLNVVSKSGIEGIPRKRKLMEGKKIGIGNGENPVRKRRKRTILGLKKKKLYWKDLEPSEPLHTPDTNIEPASHPGRHPHKTFESIVKKEPEEEILPSELSGITEKPMVEQNAVEVKMEVDVNPESPHLNDSKPQETSQLTKSPTVSPHQSKGVPHKCLVTVDCGFLPQGWIKQAILSFDDVWRIVFISPEKKELSSFEDCQNYFGSNEIPSWCNFDIDLNLLQKAAEETSTSPEIAAEAVVTNSETSQLSGSAYFQSTPTIWWRQKGCGRGRRGRGSILREGRVQTRGGINKGMRGSKRGRVRTLLPHYTYVPVVPSDPDGKMAPPSEELKWRCPKEECDKKFRKQSLLQMHIKHYHSDLKSLARNAPKMVDLACARSESANSDWTAVDSPKFNPSNAKKSYPRQFSSPSHCEEATSSKDMHVDPSLPMQGSSGRQSEVFAREVNRDVLPQPVKQLNTVKPTFPPMKATEPISMDTGDVDSEDDYIERKKNGSRIFKAGKIRRGKFNFPGQGRLHDEENSLTSNEPTTTEDGVIIERLKSEEFINCICGFREEDGLMIQCDICMCWQHGLCTGIQTESEVPERYVCVICKNPYRVRQSQRHAYSLQYLSQGKLPRFSFKEPDEDLATKEMILKRAFQIIANLYEIDRVDRSLQAKLNIADKADHPKLYMWAKNWECEYNGKTNEKKDKDGDQAQSKSGPEPEAPIDFQECRIRLLDHVEQSTSHLDDRLTSLQAQIAAIESLDADLSGPAGSDHVTKQTIQMLIRDLDTVKKLAAIT